MIHLGLVCQPKKRKQFFEPFMNYVNQNSNNRIHCYFIDYLSEQEQHHVVGTTTGSVVLTGSERDELLSELENHLSSEMMKTNVLFLKVTDDMNIEHVNENARMRLLKIETFIEKRKELDLKSKAKSDKSEDDSNFLVIEELDAVRRLLDRVEMYSFLHTKLSDENSECVVHVPAISILDESLRGNIDLLRQKLKNDGVQFPIVCKTAAACGEIHTHNMAMVFNEQQLMDEILNSETKEIPLPIVAQQFINHDGLLYKAYVIGEQVFVQERKSIRNLDLTEARIIRFNSQHKLPEELMPAEPEEGAHPRESLLEERSKLFHDITKTLSDALQLQLFGFDLIHEVGPGKFYCVDANFLPGYSGVPDVYHKMMEHVLSRYDAHINDKKQQQ